MLATVFFGENAHNASLKREKHYSPWEPLGKEKLDHCGDKREIGLLRPKFDVCQKGKRKENSSAGKAIFGGPRRRKQL